MRKKVIIIGAGPAGLTMAYELLKNGSNKEYEVEILEETNDIGGISKTVEYKGNYMDLGGHRFFSKNEDILKFWEELIPIQENPENHDNVMLVRQRISSIYYKKKFFDYPITLKLKTVKNLGFFTTIKACLSYIKSTIVKKEETSLENFYINRFGKVLYKIFFEKYTEKLWGKHPSEISADWGEQRVKGVSIKVLIYDMFNKLLGKKDNKNTETSLIEEFWYPKYGPGQLWNILANKIVENGGIIRKNYSVKNINFENQKIVSVDCMVNGKTEKIKGDIFVSSMPMNDLIKGFKGIVVPKEIQNIAEGLQFRDLRVVGILVNKLNLQNKTEIKTIGNIVPDCWIYVQEPKIKMNRIQIFNNWSPYLVKDIKNKIWIGLEYTCTEGDKYWEMSDKEFKEFAIEELVSMNIISKSYVEDCHCEKVKKAYPAYWGTYKDINKLIDYINNVDNLYCIGRNGQHRYNNMDHSMMTAINVAKNIGIEKI